MPNTTSVPFRLASEDKPIILLEASVNGQGPFSFILDTGATVPILCLETAKKLGINPTSGKEDIGHAAGGQVQVSLVSLASIKIGEAEVRDLKAAVMDLVNLKQAIGDLDGVIGYTFLSRFRVTIDYPKRVISFEAATS